MLDVYDILEDVFVTIFYSVCIALATLNMFLYGFINTGTWSLQIVLVFSVMDLNLFLIRCL